MTSSTARNRPRCASRLVRARSWVRAKAKVRARARVVRVRPRYAPHLVKDQSWVRVGVRVGVVGFGRVALLTGLGHEQRAFTLLHLRLP